MANAIRTVICVLNSKYIHSSLAPWYLAAAIENGCHCDVTAQVVEGTINERMEDVAQRIVNACPQVVGFSCYIWNISETKRLIRLVKAALPDVVIVLGGPEVSYNAEALLKDEPLVDYIVSGEGEGPFALLLDAICQGEPVSGIPGLSYREGQRVVSSLPHTPDEIPMSPYTEQYFASLHGRIAYLETSRGCPYNCAFCLSGRCGGVRYFPLDRAKQEMLRMARSGAKTIKLVDRTFNANKKRAAALFQFISDHYGAEIPQGVCFHFEIAGDILDATTIQILGSAPAGSMQLEIGLQSFHPITLEAIHRKTNVALLQENIRRLTGAGNLHIHIDLIAGLPYEDLSTFEKSFNTAYSLRPHMLQLGFLKLLHGAPMREDAEQFPCEFHPDPPYEVLSTPWLSPDKISLLHRTEDALERLYNSGRFRRTIAYVLNQTGSSPFSLFRDFGEFTASKSTDKISLDDYTAIVYEYFSGLHGINPAVLRDIMVCDRLATNSTGKLPPVLRIPDPALKKAVKERLGNRDMIAEDGIKRGYALLYTENCLVYAEYRNPHPVTGEYPLIKHQI